MDCTLFQGGFVETIIKKVENENDLNQFVNLQWKIYKGNTRWVPPLKAEVKKMLNTSVYPIWQHAERDMFIAYKDGEVAGRIAAIRDDNHDKVHGEKAGFFGFFECIEDYTVAEKLFHTAKEWCKAKGCTFLRGPASPSSNDEYGFLLEGFDLEPAMMMPYNPRYYLKLTEQYGFKKVKDLYAFFKHRDTGIPERIEKMMKRIKKNSTFVVRSLDPKHFDRDIAIIKEIYNEGWEKNWGFVPMTGAEMDFTAKAMKDFYDPNIIIIAEKDGKPAGISLTVPNINEVLKHLNGKLGPIEMFKFLYYKGKIKGCRSLVGGCKKEYRQTGLIAEIFYESMVRSAGRYEWCELGWNLEDNDLINKFDSEIGGVLYKKYRLYQISL